MFNRDINNKNFSKQTIELVWKKARPIAGKEGLAIDKCGATIKRNKYGDIDSKKGWEIDHIIPKSKGGTSDLSNLQPLQWQNNRHKGDSYPDWSCKINS